MLKGKTKTGYAYEIDESRMDDMRLIDALAEIEENPINVSKVITLLLGESGKKDMYAVIAEPDGRVPIQKVTDTLTEIMSAHGKN